MNDLLAYIRSFFFPDVNRKKRRSSFDDIEVPVKIRRTNMSQASHIEDDWHSLSSSSIKRRSGLYSTPGASMINKSKENIVYSIDDDDILEITKSKEKFKPRPSQVTSTPNLSVGPSIINGDDDVAIINCGESLSDKKNTARKAGFDYINRFTCLRDSQNTFRRPQSQTMSRTNRFGLESITPSFSSIQEIKSKLSNRNSSIRSTTLDQSFRLDEKLKYKELLSKAAPSLSPNIMDRTFSKYSTPCGKPIVDSSSRGKKLVNLSRSENKEPVLYIDLTDEKKSKPKLSTRETIKKVLNNLDSELVIIKDSDSEVEILPTPPSPKPDIKVERVNSLKKVIDTAEHSKGDWLKEIVEKYQKEITKSEKRIREQTAYTERISQINNELRAKLLEEDVKKSLQIKEMVLSVELPEEPSLPILTEEQETIVGRALNPRGNPNEVLVQKFNLSITRRDIMTLSGLNWLNDEVINFYMNLIIERGKLPQWSKAYAMNTFFYPKLLKDGPASLRRWTRKVDLFEHDFVVVPIHLGVHWCMSIIHLKNKTIKYYDSMGGSNRRCLDALLKYLEAEYADKKKAVLDTSGWELENVKDIPQQMNGSDCGMFACTFAEFITRNAKITFSQEDMPYLRRKMVLEIITGSLLII